MIPFVGLTGGIASGKTIASAQFASRGVPVVDADDVTSTLYEREGKAVKMIRREFGAEFIAEDGAVDRDILRAAVFRDNRLRKRLENITHPLIRKECLRQMGAASGIYGLLVAPLLFETDFLSGTLERVLVIDCDEKIQLQHGIRRGRFSAAQIKDAMKAQMSRAGRLKRADDLIENNGNIEALELEVEAMHKRYLEMFAPSRTPAAGLG